MPRKPITGPCEMSAGWEMNGNPRIILCRKPGVGRPDMSNFGPPIACDDCYARWKKARE